MRIACLAARYPQVVDVTVGALAAVAYLAFLNVGNEHGPHPGRALVVWDVVAARRAASPMAQSLLLAGAAGTAFGVVSILTKTVLNDLATGGFPVLSVIAIGGLAMAAVVCSQRSYRRVGMAVPLAAASVANPAVAGVVGVLLLGDSVRFGALGMVLALIAAAIIAGGIIRLTTHDPVAPSPTQPVPSPTQPAPSPTLSAPSPALVVAYPSMSM